MITVNTHEAKTKLSQLIAEVETNHEIIRICRHGKPVADLVPVSTHTNPLRQYPELNDIQIHYDPAQPMTPDEWPEEEA